MLSVKVSTKHQIAVPSEARRRLGIEAGDRLSVELTDDSIVLRRRPPQPSARLQELGAIGGIWRGIDPVDYVRDLRDEMDP